MRYKDLTGSSRYACTMSAHQGSSMWCHESSKLHMKDGVGLERVGYVESTEQGA